jgi:hypothetical protein
MTDIFFSYSSKDRERAQPIRDALVNRGFLVFWDQEVPTGIDWDSWIRQHLTESKCVIVAWSVTSIASDNVRHEAVIARQQNKIIPVLLDAIAADRFPMGLYAVQAANLCSWGGDLDSTEWVKLLNQIESKLTPTWVRRTLDTLEGELVAERSRRETAERRDRTFRERIAKEAEAGQQLRAELANALDQVAQLQAHTETAASERMAADVRLKEKVAEAGQQLRAELADALDELEQLRAYAENADEERIAKDVRIRELTTQLEVARAELQILSQKNLETHPPTVAPRLVSSDRKNAIDGGPVPTPGGAERPATIAITAIEQNGTADAASSGSSFDERWAAWQARPKSSLRRFQILGVVIAAVLALWTLISAGT